MKMSEQDVARIIASKVAILCLDTCSILDTMRDPTRKEAQAHYLSHALFLLEEMKTGTRLVGLLAKHVEHELNDHLGPVEEEARKKIRNLKQDLERIDDIATVFGAPKKMDLSHLDHHVANAKVAVEQFIGTALRFDEPTDLPDRAYARVMQARTPARQGKESMKDCVVVETYLSVIKDLRAAHWNGKAVFVSSNTNDYHGADGKLKQDLAGEFAAIGMEYAPNMGAARHMLGL